MAFFVPIRTYSGLRQIIVAFAAANGSLTFVVIVGNPGIGKTNTLRPMCGDAFILECNTTPFGLYTALYEHKDAPLLVLDDVDTLMSTPTGLNLLKALCQTDRVKRVSWNTAAADRAEIPRSFDLKARVLIFANEITGHGKNFAAVLDRGHCYSFEPTASEVHAEVQGWIERKETRTQIDPEVFSFIGEHLAQIPSPTFRDYVKATEQKAAGLDWRSGLEARWQSDPKLAAVAEIMRLYESGDPSLKTADQRARRFAEWGHGVRSTYMLYQKRLLAARGVSRLPKSGGESGVPKKAVAPVVSDNQMVDIFQEQNQ